MKFSWLDWTAIVFVIIGAVNWGLIGLFGFDLIESIFGEMTGITRTIYSLVGLSGLYSILIFLKMKEL